MVRWTLIASLAPLFGAAIGAGIAVAGASWNTRARESKNRFDIAVALEELLVHYRESWSKRYVRAAGGFGQANWLLLVNRVRNEAAVLQTRLNPWIDMLPALDVRGARLLMDLRMAIERIPETEEGGAGKDEKSMRFAEKEFARLMKPYNKALEHFVELRRSRGR